MSKMILFKIYIYSSSALRFDVKLNTLMQSKV